MIISLNSLHGDYQRFKSEGLTVETRGDTIIETDREDFPYELKHHCSVTNLKRVEVKFDYNAFIIIDDKILIYCDDENFDEITEKLRSVGAEPMMNKLNKNQLLAEIFDEIEGEVSV